MPNRYNLALVKVLLHNLQKCCFLAKNGKLDAFSIHEIYELIGYIAKM